LNEPHLQTDEAVVLPASPVRDLRWIFMGPNGLRAGWGILMFVVIWYALTVGSTVLAMRLLHVNMRAPVPPGPGILIELAQFVPMVVATWIMSLIERRPLLAYGYQGHPRTLRLLSGLVWGFIAISGLVLTMWRLGYLSLQRGSLNATSALEDAAAWGLVFLLAGFFEESLFRGYVQFTLTRGIGFWWGAVLFSLIFAFAHTTNPGESTVGLVSVVGAGIIFSLSLWYTGSLWWAVGFHATWDWGQSYFYGTPDSGMVAQGTLLQWHAQGPAFWSGGATGPEGSILIVPALLLFAGAMVLWWGRRGSSQFAGAAWRPMRSNKLS
jgi:membrane protease YdiL (CAAX protease family)